MPKLDVEETKIDDLLPAELRRDDDLDGVPEVSEVDVIRHFTRISTWNYSIDLGMYPLGSCTMKYNSRLNEKVARIDGFAGLHPLAPEEESQGALELIYRLQKDLSEITGLPGVSLQPAAGAQGEMTGVMLIRAFLDKRDGEKSKERRVMLIPDSAARYKSCLSRARRIYSSNDSLDRRRPNRSRSSPTALRRRRRCRINAY